MYVPIRPDICMTDRRCSGGGGTSRYVSGARRGPLGRQKHAGAWLTKERVRCHMTNIATATRVM